MDRACIDMHRSMDAHMQRRRDRRRRRCLCVGRSTVAVFYFRATTRPIQTSFVACFRSFRLSGSLSLSLSLSAPADPRNSTPSVPHKEEGVRNWSFFFFLLFDGRERIGRSDLDSFEVRSCFFSFSLFLLADENTTPSGVHLFACVGRSTRHLARK